MANNSSLDPSYWRSIQAQFPIAEGITYLNNGSFGPCPSPVVEASLDAFRTLETNPQRYVYEYQQRVRDGLDVLGGFVGAPASSLVFIMNVTVGMNMIANGLRGLNPGDEIIISDQEYGAVRKIWEFVSRRRGLTLTTVAIPTPPESHESIIDAFEQSMGPKTRVISFSHITSSTGMLLPVRELSELARERGVITAIDGAHGPGMFPLDIESIGCDFYTGNCHKWLCAPTGSGFLYANDEMKDMLDPLIVGWGWLADQETYVGNFENPGTHNPSMYIGAAEAVRFQESIGTNVIANRIRELTRYLRSRLVGVPGLVSHSGTDESLSTAMTTFELRNHSSDGVWGELNRRGLVPASYGGDNYPRIRVSTHIYNDETHIDNLIDALCVSVGK
jgi:isopenicillin-N epimerase